MKGWRVVLGACITLATASCSATSTCDCINPGVTLHVPVSVAAPGDSVAPSGPACSGVTASCAQPSGGSCLAWSVVPVAAGDCHIVVNHSGLQFVADVTIKQDTGCCAGFYADPAGSGDLQVMSGH